ncbi:MAG: NADH-quinone oxidoreductase subunit A [Pirellulales bacterium]|nr:NADH-quinone oxidoreductase subunit A [Pirellulales bacterium]
MLFVISTTLLALGLLGVARLFGPSRKGRVKEMPYEAGMDPIHDSRRRFDFRYHLLAIEFLVLDVELLFLYPWAVASRNPEGIQAAIDNKLVDDRMLVFGGVVLFFMILILGFLYTWRKGVFQWR